jgi:hypothetical protein
MALDTVELIAVTSNVRHNRGVCGKASFDACQSGDCKPKGDAYAKILPSGGLSACAMCRHQKKSAGNDEHKDNKFDAAVC